MQGHCDEKMLKSQEAGIFALLKVIFYTYMQLF